jgi:hypothetical protein
LLNDRIVTAKIVALSKQTINKVRFGIFITFRRLEMTQRLSNCRCWWSWYLKGKISFISCRVLLDKKSGRQSRIKIGKEQTGFWNHGNYLFVEIWIRMHQNCEPFRMWTNNTRAKSRE